MDNGQSRVGRRPICATRSQPGATVRAALRLLDKEHASGSTARTSRGFAAIRAGGWSEAIHRREFFLVWLASQPVATFSLTEQADPCWVGHCGSALYLHAFAVSRKHAGQGLGRQILDWATETAGRRGDAVSATGLLVGER